MNRKRYGWMLGMAAAVLLALYFLLSDGRASETQAAPQAAARPDPPVEAPVQAMADPSAEPFALPALDAARPNDCLIEPGQVVRVNSGVEGVIEAITVERGDSVVRGQVVARLRADVDRATAAAAQARAANVHAVRAADARAAYLESVRRRSEAIQTHLARDKVEEAQANASAATEERRAAAQEQRVAQLEYARAQRIITEKVVRSPIDGVVVERAMAVGEYRGPGASHILTIAQLDPLHVEVFAPITQLGHVAVGDSVEILPEDPVGGRYTARVTVIDRVFDAASGTFGMRLELPNPENRLPAGLRCRAEFTSNHPAAPRS